jgi:Trk K+ transport system NAD-binding subunit
MQENKEVLEIDVSSNLCSGVEIRDLSLPGDVLVLALRRNGDVLIPNDGTSIELGDHLTLIGSLECIEAARGIFTGSKGAS